MIKCALQRKKNVKMEIKKQVKKVKKIVIYNSGYNKKTKKYIYISINITSFS